MSQGRDDYRAQCVGYPPPGPVVLTNLGNALIADPDFYAEVLQVAARMGHSAVYLRKTVSRPVKGSWVQHEETADEESSIGTNYVDEINRASFIRKVQNVPANSKDKNGEKVKVVIKAKNIDLTMGPVAGPVAGSVAKRLVMPELKEEKDFAFHRLKQSDFATFPVFNGYKKGKLCHKLYIKNIDKSVTREEVTSVYMGLMKNQVKQLPFTVRHFTSGKLRGQAFVTLPDTKTAGRALRLTNGLMLKGKPIVVVFGRDERKT